MWFSMKKWSGRAKDQQDSDEELLEKLHSSSLPDHVAIITDGNGRWAKKRKLPRVAGHTAGVRRVREVIRAASQLKIPFLTFYAFSTENWRRPADEVDFLLDLPSTFLRTDLPKLMENNVHVRVIGDREALPKHTLAAVQELEGSTKDNTGLVVNFAVNYGSRDEIVHAVRSIARKVTAGDIQPEDIDDQFVSQHLLTCGVPDPDLIIRTSGEMRMSNFLLWQLAYSELLFIDTYWPDFTSSQFYQALLNFQLRSRRYGSLG